MPVKQQAGVRACCRLRDTREMTNIFLNIPVCEATPAGSQGGLDVLEKDVSLWAMFNALSSPKSVRSDPL